MNLHGAFDTAVVLQKEMAAAFHDREINPEEFDTYCGQIDVLERVAEALLGRAGSTQLRCRAEQRAQVEVEATRRKQGLVKQAAAEPSSESRPIEEVLQELAADVPAEEWATVRPSDDQDGNKRAAALEAKLAEARAELAIYYEALEMAACASELFDDLSPGDWIAKARETASNTTPKEVVE